MAVISGKGIREGNLVSEYIAPIQFQPAGIDLSLKEVHSLEDAGRIDFDNSKRKLSGTKKIEFGADGSVHLPAGCYKVIYNEYVKIPKDCIALAYTRSSLLRCGAYLQCAVWDPGYEGRSESLLVVGNKNGIVLEKNARIVQLVFVKMESEAHEGYSGKYQKENK